MEILFITSEFPPYLYGGMGIYAKEIVRELLIQGHDVKVVSKVFEEDLKKRKDIGNVRWFIIKRGKILGRNLVRWWISLLQNLLSSNSEIVHLNITDPLPIRFWKIPTFLTIHHVGKKFPSLLKFAIKYSDAIIVPSKKTKKELFLSLNRCNENLLDKIYVLYNGISQEFLPKRKIKEEQKVIVFPHALREPRKNLLFIIPIIKKLQKKFDFVFLITGKLSKNPYWLKKMTACLKNNHIRFRYAEFKELSKLAQIYETSYCVVYPSKLEGFSLVPLEVFASGGIALSSQTADLEEIREKLKINSLFILPLKEELWFEKIKTILEDENLRYMLKKSSTRSSKKIHEHFSWEKNVKQLIKIYKKYL